MRVITGTARGRRLQTLEGNDVRPTTDKVKEAVFSSIQFDIEDRRVLDLFAGSGQLGIEALSRGAKSATFVDLNPEAINVIKANIKTTGFEGVSKIVRTDCFSYLAQTREEFDIYSKKLLQPPPILLVITALLFANAQPILSYQKRLAPILRKSN